ncbi:MAG TPA: glutathione S-transferase N-terminal domain-containing protein [Usitatibacter sp.]|nr:glutathione S-transferase N-terminal domain-containing protein [Usitatibacter sp.]
MSIKLYYAPGACSFAPHITLEEVGVPYETQRLNLAAGDQRKPEYLKLNARGRVPTLVVDKEVLTEVVGILSYFGGGYPQAGLWPKRTWDQAKIVSSMAWLSNTVHTTYGQFFRPERYVDDSAAQAALKAKARIRYGNYLAEIDRLLAGRRWCIADHYTVIDAYLLVFYRWGNRNQFPVKSLSHYTALMERVLARPAVKKVMADEGITLD